ncbi:Chemotaxis response regulator CheB, contains REC and protein-glutamate methylesterase domains [Dokdonella immobilis]|uniref:protein-glutamate methylesterase n=2 Tax=Dokdonella immobilis TaxID=578942 RepID=A0A1I4WWU7_9GAMM|nr:Chemotaxis response regulator CheB, contains REC and protein-glutamate methylesterase domains [Dokdonella immobilis]
MPTPDPNMSIALLSQAGESGRHLREALLGSGAPIVYEAQAAELDRDALERSGARVVVVNLDTEVEAHLDEVYSLLGDDRYNVIFNEAQVSSQLSGWEQARWARHLAAKILGTENADPPRPEGAEAVPQPAPRAPLEAKAEGPVAPADSAEPAAHADVGAAGSEVTQETAELVQEDYSDIASLLAEGDRVLPQADDSGPAASARADVDSRETVPMPVLDLSEFDDLDVAASTGSAADLDFDPESTREMPTVEFSGIVVAEDTESETLGFADLDDFADGDEVSDFEFADDSVAAASASVDEDLAEAVEAGEAAAAGAGISGLQMLDLDWADAPEVDSKAAAGESAPPTPPSAIGSAFAWSLEDIDEGGPADATKSESEPPKPTEFGIETISASEYLAPDAEPASDEPFDAGLSLELIPLDEAVAPQPAGQTATAHAGSESWLDTSTKVAVSRVWVLGASIGGPEAVREFLSHMPKNCPALFLLAQHMGAEFMDIMAQQLVRSTVLTVRTPSHGERVGHGDIVVVPTTHRLRVDREGVITLETLNAGDLPNSPSIDQVVEDVADRFGARAGVIVFSGMAEDAAQGSRHLAAKGGKVYAQDPDTCVISSMVDGVIETGVVDFTGSPRALAERVLDDFKSAARK